MAETAARPKAPGRLARLWIPGAGLGFLGVLAFSFSLPANKLAVAGIDPLSITAIRAGAAGLLALGYLLISRAGIPGRGQLVQLALSSLGIVVGFPLFTSIALLTSESGHSAVTLGLLPAVTAVFGAVVGGERLPRAFWVACLGGVAILVGYLAVTSYLETGIATIGVADLWMLAATVSAGYGYAVGGRQAKLIGGPRTVSWALVLLLPLSIPASMVAMTVGDFTLTPLVIGGMAYLIVISQFLGFFAWYGGLARGGIARVGQIQQVQPLLTLVWAAVLLGESFNPWTIVVGVAVAVLVTVAQRARFARAA